MAPPCSAIRCHTTNGTAVLGHTLPHHKWHSHACPYAATLENGTAMLGDTLPHHKWHRHARPYAATPQTAQTVRHQQSEQTAHTGSCAYAKCLVLQELTQECGFKMFTAACFLSPPGSLPIFGSQNRQLGCPCRDNLPAEALRARPAQCSHSFHPCWKAPAAQSLFCGGSLRASGPVIQVHPPNLPPPPQKKMCNSAGGQRAPTSSTIPRRMSSKILSDSSIGRSRQGLGSRFSRDASISALVCAQKQAQRRTLALGSEHGHSRAHTRARAPACS
eukprot:366388-Chlamydomonas_euryale.AAC.14